jgi:hypothetical protein
MAATADFNNRALLESDAELRALVSAILGGRTKGDSYLDDVFSICRRKPQSASILREIIDRHRRLGRMPRTQHRKIRTRIEQAQPRRAPAAAPAAISDGPANDGERLDEQTCDLSAEPIAAASRGISHASRRPLEGLIDPNPTLESPPPRGASRSVPPALAARADLVAERTELLAERNERVAEIAAIVAEHSGLIAERLDLKPERFDLTGERTEVFPPLLERTEVFPPLLERTEVFPPPLERSEPRFERSEPRFEPATQQAEHSEEVLEPPLPSAPLARVVRNEIIEAPAIAPVAAPPPIASTPLVAGVPPVASTPPAIPSVAWPAAKAPAEAPADEELTFEPKLSDRYELQQLIGRGGMASVYKAIDRERVRLGLADRFVAVKVVRTDASRPGRAAALIQEFQSAQRLSHPNVINVFDIDQVEDATFYSMELLSGARLSQVLRRVDGTALQRRYALAIIRDIGAAVSHAHARGVVHADLKPSNVMVTQQGDVRVLDFGGSSMPPREPWVSDGDADDAFHHATPAYASCEQLERRRADPRDDIYALGCMAYLLLTGRHPFDYLSSIEARSRGIQVQRPPGVPLKQWRALRQALSWKREDRPASVDEWLARLGFAGAAPRLPPLHDLTAPAAPRGQFRRALLLALIVIATTAGVWALLSNPHPKTRGVLGARIGSAQDSAPDTPQAPGATRAAGVAPVHGASDNRATSPPARAATPPPAAAAAGGSRTASRTLTAAAPVSAAVSPPAPALASAPAAASAPALAATSEPASARADDAVSGALPHVAFAAPSYLVGPGDPAARIVIQRQAGTQGDLNFIWWTEGGTAEPDVDYASLGARTEHLASGQDKLTVYVPIISNPLRARATQFRVALVDATSHRGDGGAQSTRATVTIEGNR